MRFPLQLLTAALIVASTSFVAALAGTSMAAGAVTGLPRSGLPNTSIIKTSAVSTGDAVEIESRHPADYYKLAAKLFAVGKKDDAVFWFYAGQLRFRAYLVTHPDLAPDGAPALFSSLSESIGRPINEYAFGDTATLTDTLDRVLVWDAAHADPFNPKGPKRESVVEGLRQMKAQIVATADDIRAQRLRNGLVNR